MTNVKSERKYIPVVKRNEVRKVFLEQVLMIEQDCRKINIRTSEDVISLYTKMDVIKQYLDKRFYQCHKSCVLNMSKVIQMREQTIFFETGFALYMGRESYTNAKQFFARFIRLMDDPIDD